MKTTHRLLLLSSLTLVAACSSSDDSGQSQADLSSRNRTCQKMEQESYNVQPCSGQTFDWNHCVAEVRSCSDSDLTAVNALLDCINNLGVCSTASQAAEAAYLGGMSACEEQYPTQNISIACRNALDGVSDGGSYTDPDAGWNTYDGGWPSYDGGWNTYDAGSYDAGW